jgi:lipopolysaccharide transport system permease protein
LWGHRYLIEQMIRRDLSQRYKGSFLGLVWSVLNPLLMLLIYTFVFSIVFKARWRLSAESEPLGEFAITMFASLIPFYLFSETVNRSPTLVVSNLNYVKKVVFPLEILPVVSTGAALVNSMINLAILLTASLLVLGKIPATIIFIPLIYITLLFLSLGLSWFLASWGVYVRDVGQVVAIVVQVLFFITPIFYPAESVPERFRFIALFNPLTMIVEDFRKLLLWGEFFPLREWFFWTIASVLIAVSGYVWFIATKKGFADVI